MKYIANPVEVNGETIIGVPPGDENGGVELTLEGGNTFYATPAMCSRYTPKEGDYLVTQSDGYQYLKPKDVFERKYHKA